MIGADSDNIKIEGHTGTWYVIDWQYAYGTGEKIFLLEHEQYGDEADCIIVDADGKIVMEDVTDGFDQYDEEVGR